MGKKYIVEIGRLERLYKASVSAHGKPNITWLSPEVDLTPYTEPDIEQVRKEGYEQGYKDGKYFGTDGAYRKGLADAWEAARKIASDDAGQNHVIFGQYFANVIFNTFTASEAIEEIRAYEQAQKEKEEQIQVGDEVATDAGNRASILYENPDGTQAFVFKSDGTAAWWTKSALHRTGRNFPEIATVLEKMREESNG